MMNKTIKNELQILRYNKLKTFFSLYELHRMLDYMNRGILISVTYKDITLTKKDIEYILDRYNNLSIISEHPNIFFKFPKIFTSYNDKIIELINKNNMEEAVNNV